MRRKKILLVAGVFATLGIGVGLFSLRLAPVSRENTSPSEQSENIERLVDESLSLLTPHASSTTQTATTTVRNTPTITYTFKPVAKKITTPVAPPITGCSLLVTTSKTYPSQETTQYVLTVQNGGTQICENVSFSTYYASDEALLSATPKPSASNYYWVLGTLASGKSTQVSFMTTKPSTQSEQTESCITADNARQDVCTTFQNNVTATSDTPTTHVQPPAETTPVAPPPISLGTKENGLWVWNSPIMMNQAYRDTLITTAVQNSFNVLYVTIDDYLNIAFLPDGPEKSTKKNAYVAALELLIRQAQQKGIAIDAEAGWKDWAEPDQQYKAFAIIDFVKEYNATHTYTLRGLQYDVEPYLLASYEQSKAVVLQQYIAFIDQSVQKLEGNALRFSIVIPHFYDETQRWTPAFSYKGTYTFAFNHLLSIVDTRLNSSIILMSYRNFAEGKNGTNDISRAEIEKASRGGYSTRIIVAQETGNVEPDYVTFYGTSKNYFIEQTNRVKETFLPYANFGGMATHYLEPYLDLK